MMLKTGPVARDVGFFVLALSLLIVFFQVGLGNEKASKQTTAQIITLTYL
jgi:hypothetical protein